MDTLMTMTPAEIVRQQTLDAAKRIHRGELYALDPAMRWPAEGMVRRSALGHVGRMMTDAEFAFVREHGWRGFAALLTWWHRDK